MSISSGLILGVFDHPEDDYDHLIVALPSNILQLGSGMFHVSVTHAVFATSKMTPPTAAQHARLSSRVHVNACLNCQATSDAKAPD